jgi:hypothetical protein
MGSGVLEERERGWEVNVFIRYSNQHVVVLEHNRSSEERKKDNDNETEGVSQS